MLSKHRSGWVILFCFFLLQASGIASAGGDLRGQLERLRKRANPTVVDVPLASTRLLDDFYRARDYRYAWHSIRQVEDLLRLAESSVDDGLRPSDFHAQEISNAVGNRKLSDMDATKRVDLEILLSDGLLRLIHHNRYGKVDPHHLDKKWDEMDGPFAKDLVDDLERVVSASNLQAEVEDIVSKPSFYKRLREALAQYLGIAATGGWPQIPAGGLLRPGVSDPRVTIIRKRLRATSDYNGPASDSDKYDAELEAAVLAFQARHHLGTDAVVGPATLAAMNISADERVDQIRVNLERMRWVSDRLPKDLLLVDIAGQEVRLFRGAKPIWTSRIIVGRPERPTPTFRDQVEYLEINPSWTVPPTILRKDILPAMRKNPGYLKKKGLQVVTRDGKPVSPGSVNWNTSAARFPYMIRQPPGARNALGQVKFMFPNRFSVYLHDTPSRKLFDKPRRLYSSGCVRVDKPWELAELVLNDPERWNRERFEEIVATGRTRWVHLKEPLPVILAYWTAEAEEDGEVVFREDIYARDAAVLSALDGRGPLRILFDEPVASAPPEKQKAAVPRKELKTMPKHLDERLGEYSTAKSEVR